MYYGKGPIENLFTRQSNENKYVIYLIIEKMYLDIYSLKRSSHDLFKHICLSISGFYSLVGTACSFKYINKYTGISCCKVHYWC